MSKKNKEPCELCENAKSEGEHHIIPKYIVKKINKNCRLKDFTVDLCNKCHREVHYSFINHIIMAHKKGKEFNYLHALKYLVLEDFMKRENKKVYDKFRIFWKEYVNDCVENMEE